MTQSRILRFRIVGMDCMDEVAALRGILGPIVGDEARLTFDVLQRRMTIDASDKDVSLSQVMEAVAQAGMRAEPWDADGAHASVEEESSWRRSCRWTAASGIFILSAGALQVANGRWFEWSGSIVVAENALLALAVASGLRLVGPKAASAARRLRPDMNLLMVIAVLGAAVIGEYLEAATVTFLFALAATLETWSVRRARRAISELLDLSSPTARVLGIDGVEQELSIEQVVARSRILVKPGERIPLDGIVVAGTSHVNQAPITGESVPVGKQGGDTVFAGTVNGNGALTIETTKAADDTTVAHIVRMVEEAQSRRSPSEQWVEKFARYYTPCVLVVAIAIMLIPPLFIDQPWGTWFYRSLVLLVIACPCALVISTPVCIVSSLASAARHGVLIKGGVFVEAPARLRAVAFDKTGTLTEGRPIVRRVIPLNGHSEAELVERAAALEASSEHPLATAILDYARAMKIDGHKAEDYQVIPGKGATGRWKGERYWLGSIRFLQERQQQTSAVELQIAELAEQGQTVVVVGNDRHVCGLLAIADAVRPTAKIAIAGLKAAGIKRVIMLTGDTAAAARAIGDEIGIDEVRAQLLPEEKVHAVEALVREFGNVAMVGDGVNDAPALATATLGVAMGVAGSDAAIETADIALMSNDLTKLTWTVEMSRRTLAIIQQNILLSLMVKVGFFALTLVGYASLWGAITADMGASFVVIFNGLRLLRK